MYSSIREVKDGSWWQWIVMKMCAFVNQKLVRVRWRVLTADLPASNGLDRIDWDELDGSEDTTGPDVFAEVWGSIEAFFLLQAVLYLSQRSMRRAKSLPYGAFHSIQSGKDESSSIRMSSSSTGQFFAVYRYGGLAKQHKPITQKTNHNHGTQFDALHIQWLQWSS